MKKKLETFCKKLHIDNVGIAPVVPYKDLEKILKHRIEKGYITGMEEKDLKKRVDPKETMKDAASIIVCLFPYFTGNRKEANIAKYTYGLDYHIIIKEKLQKIGEFLKSHMQGFDYEPFVDTGPLVDRYLAYSAGLGYFGINNHILTDQYGSYVFIGYMINNYPFEVDRPLNQTCIQCGECIKKCPGNAILGNFEVDPRKCISFITQKKEALTEEEINILRKNKMIFGCDICQDVCPHNQNIAHTNIKEFQENLVYTLKEKDVEELSNKAFKRKYGDRSFSWRGKKVILRNFHVLNTKDE
ncbi:tRNA epoxyqueuosine(34) reductase QueG [Crassaminicella profunda]|uniref:tRNA epoxyqueuosine(34) reductase QueG n=1 Tax=Crassaminicella profunda TaxID=1286698 RepID=UPI001CA64E48|nr:tRNA epoxyqueuosine(34) reductase QueG [Crassaminicella profunda]QZY54152.1 tRNA epoxyqueuosine(34) reductase QueG [Crassaminicella profunda]